MFSNYCIPTKDTSYRFRSNTKQNPKDIKFFSKISLPFNKMTRDWRVILDKEIKAKLHTENNVDNSKSETKKNVLSQ